MESLILPTRTLDPAAPLRLRKREKLRFAVQDAALALFSTQGFEATTIEQIVTKADTSVSTFFRYFRSKADILVNDDDGQHLRALQHDIQNRPHDEPAIASVCHGLLSAWVYPIDDPQRQIAMAAVVESSTLLLGLRYEVISGWIDAVAHTLAAREGRAPVARRHRMIARMVIGVFCDTVWDWLAGDCRDDLRSLLLRDFDMMTTLGSETLTIR